MKLPFIKPYFEPTLPQFLLAMSILTVSLLLGLLWFERGTVQIENPETKKILSELSSSQGLESISFTYATMKISDKNGEHKSDTANLEPRNDFEDALSKAVGVSCRYTVFSDGKVVMPFEDTCKDMVSKRKFLAEIDTNLGFISKNYDSIVAIKPVKSDW